MNITVPTRRHVSAAAVVLLSLTPTMALADQGSSAAPSSGTSGGDAAFSLSTPVPDVQTALLLQQSPDQNPNQTPNSPTDTTGPAPQANNDKIRFGPELGLYFPTEAKTRTEFGARWFSIGLGLGDVSEIHRNNRIALDFAFLAASSHGDAAYVAPLGASYTTSLTSNKRGLIPYAGGAVDIVFADLGAPSYGVPQRLSVTDGAAGFVGLDFGETAYLEARYNEFAQTRGFDLSGLDLNLGIRF